MIKQCVACGKDFDAKTNGKYCTACRPVAYKKVKIQACRRWRKNNANKCAEYKHNWQQNNSEAVQKQRRRRYKNHQEEEKERSRIWREQNPDKVQAQHEKKRAKYHLERKKARLRAVLQANAAKRQTELLKHEKLYPSMNHWDNELPTISF